MGAGFPRATRVRRLYGLVRRAPHGGVRLAAIAGLVFAAAGAWAQPAWPTRPMRVVVPVVPGSFTDVVGRALAAEIAEASGQPAIVDNRPGAGTTIGASLVAKSAPDGHALLMTENSFSIAPALYRRTLPFDPLRDFQPVTLVAEAPTLWFVRNDAPMRSARDLVALARARPGELTFATGGNGTSSHLAAELFIDLNKLRMVHVPFKGVAASIGEVVAGRLDVGTSSIASAVTAVKAGRMRALAVTGRERNPLLPDVPTFAESGFPDYDMPIWFGLIGPAGIPAPLLERMHAVIAQAAQRPRPRELFASQGASAPLTPPAAFSKRVAAEIALWREVVPRVGAEPN